MTSIEIIQHCVESKEEMLVCTDLASETSQQIYQARQDLLSYYEKHYNDLEAIILVLRYTQENGYRIEYVVDKMFETDPSVIDVQIHAIAKKGKLVMENIFPHTDKLITNNKEFNFSQLITVMSIEAEKPHIKLANPSKPEKRKCDAGGNLSKEISKAPKAQTNSFQSKSIIEEEPIQQFTSVNQSKRVKIIPKKQIIDESHFQQVKSNQNLNSGQIQQEMIVEEPKPQECQKVAQPQPQPSKSEPVPIKDDSLASKKPNVKSNKNIMSYFAKK